MFKKSSQHVESIAGNGHRKWYHGQLLTTLFCFDRGVWGGELDIFDFSAIR